MADIKEELKAAGFGLAFRKSIAEMPELATLTKALEANLGFTLKVDWKSMVGSDDDETVKVVRVLKEAVFAGLASDVSTLGTDELGALAADSASKCLEVARGTENSVGWTGADKHLKLTFKLGDNVTYPSKGLDVRDFVLNNTGGADDPAAVLPKGGLGKKCTPNKKCEVVFKAPPPAIGVSKGWIRLPCTLDPKKAYTPTAITSASIIAVRDNEDSTATIVTSNGVMFLTRVEFETVLASIKEANLIR